MYAILRTAKLKTFGNIAASASHNFRERETLNADPERTHLNIHHGAVSSDEVTAKVKNLLPEKVRSNAVLCIEYLITASPEFFENGAQNLDYFERARDWLVNKHGEKNIVYSGIQLDEKTPHMVGWISAFAAATFTCRVFWASARTGAINAAIPTLHFSSSRFMFLQ